MRKFVFLLTIFIVSFFSALAQTGTLTGQIINESANPVSFASVYIKGSNRGTSADANGNFSLPNAIGKTLVVSATGYQTIEYTATQNNVQILLMASSSTTIDEVVVTAMGIAREKRSLGAGSSTISATELTESKSPSVINSLTGKVAGINITTTAGAPGSSSRVVLRGGSSITGNNQALIVVDGVPIDNSSTIGGSSLASVDFGNRGNDINPEDIESITVLKGPAAAALYGSRASNGALIITTKKGGGNANKKNEITFSTTNTLSSILKLPDFQNEYGQGYYVDFDDDGNLVYEHDPKENWSWGAPFDGTVMPWGQEIDGKRLEKPYSALPNNVRNFFKTGFTTDNNLSLSGRGEKTTYYLGLNGLHSNNIYPGDYDYYNRYGVRFNGETKLSNKFSSSISINYTKINSNSVGSGQGGFSVYNNLIQTPRDIPIDKMSDLSNKYYGYGYTDATGVYHDNLYGYYGAYTNNPYWVLKNYKNYNDVDRILGSFTIEYKPNNWLQFLNRLGGDIYTDSRKYHSPKYTLNPADNTTGNYSTSNVKTGVGGYQEVILNVSEIVNDFMITAKHDFSEDFNGSLLLGNSIRQRITNNLNSQTNTTGGLVVPGWYNLANSNGEVIASNTHTIRRIYGFYGEVNLAYQNMLFFNGTLRNDHSSTLPVKNSSYWYPGANISFVFSELMKGNHILSYGKLRAAWAQVGNDADPYMLISTYDKTTINGGFGVTRFPFGGVAGLTTGSVINNPDLRPEITTASEIGAELGFLKNRLTIDFSYYQNKSKDQILAIPLAVSTGFGSRVVNAGVVKNNGIELSLRGIPIKTTNITWELYGTYSKNKNKVISLMPGVQQVVIGGFSGMGIVANVGQTYGTFYGVTDSVDAATGKVVVDASSGMPLLTTGPRFLGSYMPKYIASIGTNFTYKNLAFNVLFDTKQGGKFFSRTKDITEFVGTAAITGGNRNPQVWPNSLVDKGNGLEPNTDVKFIPQDYYPDASVGTMVVDASYVKLRSAGISYNFPQHILSKTPFGGLTIALYGNNLFIWTAKENKYADPEINASGAGNEQGFDFTAQPSIRNYGINLKFTF